jgi:hypothetical protein
MEKIKIESLLSWERTELIYKLLDDMYDITQAESPRDMYDIANDVINKYERNRTNGKDRND